MGSLRNVALLILCACKQEVAIDVPPESEIVREPTDVLKRVRPSMGTYVELSFSGVAEERASRAAEEVFTEFDRIDRMMSEWRPESALSKVNAAAGERAVEVDRELFDLVERALDFSAKTQGSFDPSFAAMWGLWTFGDDGVNRLPDPKEVERRRRLIDWKRVKLDREHSSIFLAEKGMKLGLGGIAKGYATDRAVAILREHGVKNFVIKAGGELFAAGKKGDQAWRVGVRDPRGAGHFATIDLSDRAFGTSGDYERFFMVDGVRYHHIIDPKTGYPATASRSVTVLAADATTADGLSKALFILGPEKGLALAEAMGVEAVIVGADNRLVVSKGLEGRLLIQQPPSP